MIGLIVVFLGLTHDLDILIFFVVLGVPYGLLRFVVLGSPIPFTKLPGDQIWIPPKDTDALVERPEPVVACEDSTVDLFGDLPVTLGEIILYPPGALLRVERHTQLLVGGCADWNVEALETIVLMWLLRIKRHVDGGAGRLNRMVLLLAGIERARDISAAD